MLHAIEILPYIGLSVILLMLLAVFACGTFASARQSRRMRIGQWIAIAIFASAMLHSMATKPDNGSTNATPRQAAPPLMSGTPLTDEPTNAPPSSVDEPIRAPFAVSCFVKTPSNILMEASWTCGFFSSDTILDCFASFPTLTNDWHWIMSVPALAAETNALLEVTLDDLPGCTNFPPALFLRVNERISTLSNLDDADGDGVLDSSELSEGTNPLDAKNYCYMVAANISDIFKAKYRMMCNATFGTNEIFSVGPITNKSLSVDFGHLTATNREYVTMWFWDDANSNAVRDAAEDCTQVSIMPKGHQTVYAAALPTGKFDRDSNGLLDWWERDTGLASVEERHKDFDDNDHDGLINLHEYWAGCDPLTPDGSNTLLSVCARSVDDRIATAEDRMSVMDKFENYILNGSNGVFVVSTNFWLKGVDSSGISMWNSSERDIWGGHCNYWHQGGVAVTRKHILCAHHYGIPNGTMMYFMSCDGALITNQIVKSISLSSGDIRVSELANELPSSVKVVKVLPHDYPVYLGNLRNLPAVTFNQSEHAVVCDLTAMPKLDNRGTLANGTRSHDDSRSSMYEDCIAGDSGSPRCIIAGEELVLICCMWKGGPGYAGSGAFVTHYISEINAAINRLSPEGNYSLEELDIAEYEMLKGGVE